MPPTDGFSTPPPCLSSSASLPTHHCNITPPVAQIPLRSWAGTLGRGFGSQGHGHIAPWVRACLSSGSTLGGRVGPGYPKVACPFCKSPFPSYPLAPPQPYGFPRPNLFTWLRPPSTWLNSPQIYPIGRLFPTLGPCVNRRSHLSAPSLLWWVLSDPRHATIHEIMIYTPILPQSSGLLFFGLHHSKPFFHNSLSFISYCQHQPVPFSISFCTTTNSTKHHSSQRRHAATTQGIEYFSFYLSLSLSSHPKHPVCRPLRHYSAHFLSRFLLSYFLLSTSPFLFCLCNSRPDPFIRPTQRDHHHSCHHPIFPVHRQNGHGSWWLQHPCRFRSSKGSRWLQQARPWRVQPHPHRSGSWGLQQATTAAGCSWPRWLQLIPPRVSHLLRQSLRSSGNTPTSSILNPFVRLCRTNSRFDLNRILDEPVSFPNAESVQTPRLISISLHHIKRHPQEFLLFSFSCPTRLLGHSCHALRVLGDSAERTALPLTIA